MIDISDKKEGAREALASGFIHLSEESLKAITEGTVREKSGDITVTALEYEAYIEMAESTMQNILAGSIKKFALIDAVAVHRIGRLGIGEASIAIAVSAQHRKEGFDGCSEILNRIKAEAPIWKKDIIDEKITRWHD